MVYRRARLTSPIWEISLTEHLVDRIGFSFFLDLDALSSVVEWKESFFNCISRSTSTKFSASGRDKFCRSQLMNRSFHNIFYSLDVPCRVGAIDWINSHSMVVNNVSPTCKPRYSLTAPQSWAVGCIGEILHDLNGSIYDPYTITEFCQRDDFCQRDLRLAPHFSAKMVCKPHIWLTAP